MTEERKHRRVFVLTELIKVRLHAVGPWHRADEPGLQEGAPLVHQATVSPIIVLFRTQRSFSITHTCFAFLLHPKPSGATHANSACRFGRENTGKCGGQCGKRRLLLMRFSHLWRARTDPIQYKRAETRMDCRYGRSEKAAKLTVNKNWSQISISKHKDSKLEKLHLGLW